MSCNKAGTAAVAAASAATSRSAFSSSSPSTNPSGFSCSARGKGGKGEGGGKGGKGGKGAKGETAPPAASSDAMALANAGLMKAFTENAAVYDALEHETVDGPLCVGIRDLGRRLHAQGSARMCRLSNIETYVHLIQVPCFVYRQQRRGAYSPGRAHIRHNGPYT